VDEVLEDDPLLAGVGFVEELTDVRPARHELHSLLAGDVAELPTRSAAEFDQVVTV
jgi:hypothetical protein